MDPALQRVVVDLAESQKFKCYFCSKKQNLILEHDHDPYEGDDACPTAYNTRGLVCDGCNWHLMLYEKDELGEHRGWDHVDCRIGVYEYDNYVEAYLDRYVSLCEARIEKTCPNYWARRLVLHKFDRWKELGRDFPWQWRFEEIKEKRHGAVRTSAQLLKRLNAVLKFLMAQKERDPSFRPSDQTLKHLGRIKIFMDDIKHQLIARGWKFTDTDVLRP